MPGPSTRGTPAASQSHDDDADQFEGMHEGTRAMFGEYNERMQEIQDAGAEMQESLKQTQESVAAILAKLRKSGKRRLDDEGDDDEEVEDDVARPIRGAHGASEPISVKYAYLDAKVREQAIAGSLAPESLPLLIDSTSSFARPGVQDGSAGNVGFVFDADTFSFRPVPAKKGDKVASFMAAIPNHAYFMYAWWILMDLMMKGSPENASQVFEGLFWYGKWIVDKSTTHTWESVCRYHLRVTVKRFAGTFSLRQWYNVVDHNAISDLVLLPRPVDEPESSTSAPKRRRNGVKGLGRSVDEPCLNFNSVGCHYTECKRLHVCSACWPDKRATHKKSWPRCPSRKRVIGKQE